MVLKSGIHNLTIFITLIILLLNFWSDLRKKKIELYLINGKDIVISDVYWIQRQCCKQWLEIVTFLNNVSRKGQHWINVINEYHTVFIIDMPGLIAHFDVLYWAVLFGSEIQVGLLGLRVCNSSEARNWLMINP